MKTLLLAATAVAAFAVPASAQIVVDGTRDAAYGAVDSSVTFDANAPTSNFGAPTGSSNTTAYTISLETGANSLYGFLQAQTATGLQFANLYFGRPEGGFSLGFEIGQNGVNAFIPANGTKVTLDSSLYQTSFSTDGKAIEFSLSNSLFLNPIAGLTYTSGATPAPGGNVRLNLSQSFGYSVAGGQTAFGDTRLGVAAIGVTAAVPEPASWAMMIGGFGLVGGAARRRRSQRTTVSFA